MKLKRHLKFFQLALLLVPAGSTAFATSITYNTNDPNTGFNGTTNNILLSSAGASASLAYIDNVSSTSGVPSNIDYGNFTLSCASCTTQALGTGSTFSAFTFKLIVTDTTDGAAGYFLGTSTGGQVYSDVSQITVNWSPLQLGPGTNNASSGSFGNTVFTTTSFTGIVAPNSGTVHGQTTIQGHVDSAVVTPEPASAAMIGGAMLMLGLWRIKVRRASQVLVPVV